MPPKIFVALKAFIVFKGKVLIIRESLQYKDGVNAGRYDVVGGRVKPGQRFDESLIREIKEETGLSVKIGKPFCVNEWRPVVKGEPWQVVGTFFECFAKTDKVVLSKDHDDYRWIDPRCFRQYMIIKTNTPAFKSYIKNDA
jgi:8-oxo-dGTP diphosphatase